MKPTVTPPCKDCEDRTPGCHSTCKRYIEWQEEYQNRKDYVYGNSEKERMLGSFFARNYEKTIRRTNSKK